MTSITIYRRKNKSTKQVQSDKHLVIGGYTIKNAYDIRDYILNVSDWYADLIENKNNRRDLTERMLKDKNKHSEFNRIITYYRSRGKKYLGDALIRFFIPEHPVVLDSESFDLYNSTDMKRITAKVFSYLLFDIWHKSSSKDIQFYLFNALS